ncbi:MAG: hypothetical protein V7640_3402 [Betaproteobacteria bacterium]|jgi:hypothetical protein
MVWNFYCGVFGGWRWEQHEDGQFVDESRYGFDTRAECVEDAERHGYSSATKASLARTTK